MTGMNHGENILGIALAHVGKDALVTTIGSRAKIHGVRMACISAFRGRGGHLSIFPSANSVGEGDICPSPLVLILWERADINANSVGEGDICPPPGGVHLSQ